MHGERKVRRRRRPRHRPRRPLGHTRTGPRDRQGGLHLRLPDGGQLPRACTPTSSTRTIPSTRAAGTRSTTPQGSTRPTDTAIQTPNSDTPYSAVGADLRTEPLVLTVPPIEQDRYYSLQFIDALHLQLRLRRQPHHRQRRRQVPTGRTELEGRQTRRHQRGHPLRHRPGAGAVPHPTVRARRPRQRQEDPGRLSGAAAVGVPEPAAARRRRRPIDFVPPLTADQERTSPQFFDILNFVLQFAPTLPEEKEMRDRFATIGIGPDGDFDADKLSPEMRTAIESGMADAWAEFDTLQEGQDRHRRGGVGRALRHRGRPQGQLPVPDGGRGARHLRQHRGRGHLPEFRQRLGRRTADRSRQLHHPTSPRASCRRSTRSGR